MQAQRLTKRERKRKFGYGVTGQPDAEGPRRTRRAPVKAPAMRQNKLGQWIPTLAKGASGRGLLWTVATKQYQGKTLHLMDFSAPHVLATSKHPRAVKR